jgi:oligopeptide transport system substrate-binding protein
MSFSTLKYRDVDVAQRARKRVEWNKPVTWPAWVLLAIAAVVFAPAVRTALQRLR